MFEWFTCTVTIAHSKTDRKKRLAACVCFDKELGPGRRQGANRSWRSIKVEFIVLHNDQFTIQHTTIRQTPTRRFEQFGEIAIERLFDRGFGSGFHRHREISKCGIHPTLGSNIQTRSDGIVSQTRLASIGSTGGLRGRFISQWYNSEKTRLFGPVQKVGTHPSPKPYLYRWKTSARRTPRLWGQRTNPRSTSCTMTLPG